MGNKFASKRELAGMLASKFRGVALCPKGPVMPGCLISKASSFARHATSAARELRCVLVPAFEEPIKWPSALASPGKNW